jgi:diacylglycerol kinase
VFILVLSLGFYFQISKIEWIILLICSMAVLSLEGVNTSIERLCDEVEPRFNLKIKIIKDAAAGAVLISSIISAVIGILIFFPYIYALMASL